jgi:hypothetical protein
MQNPVDVSMLESKEPIHGIPNPAPLQPKVPEPGIPLVIPAFSVPCTPGPKPIAIRGERGLRWLERGFSRLDWFIERTIPPGLNPMLQFGAIANTCLLIAVLSGIALLIWYVPSVHQAHASLEQIRHSSWLGQWVRSLHRYSSDACMFMILLHAARIFVQRRFSGGRWLPWVTGIVLLALVWVIGWTGYWLVWDVRAQHVAVGTAKFVDRLPLFVEPLTRSFLTDESVHSLLFFLIFFGHMLMPLVVGVALWLHLMRVGRGKIIAGKTMTIWIIGSLAVMSALLPATSAGTAEMTAKAQRFTMDWWYLWPVALTDRLSGGMLWAIVLFGSAVLLAVPWWMTKRASHIISKGARLENGETSPPPAGPGRRLAGGLLLASLLGGITFAFSNLPYRTPLSPEPELVISFNHSGQLVQPRALTPEELEKRLPHMRNQVSVAREKSPVHLRVTINGEEVWNRSYRPRGLAKDGPSVAIVRLPVRPGIQDVKVDIADTADIGNASHQWHQAVEFEESRAHVLLFDARAGFSIH